MIGIPLTTFLCMPLIALALFLDLFGLGAPAWFFAGLSLDALIGIAHFTAQQPGGGQTHAGNGRSVVRLVRRRRIVAGPVARPRPLLGIGSGGVRSNRIHRQTAAGYPGIERWPACRDRGAGRSASDAAQQP